MNIPDFDTWSTKMQGEKYIKKHFSEFYNFLMITYPEAQTIKEKIYLYRNNLKEPQKCVVCGKPTKYDGPSKGYRKYCSSTCCNNDPYKINKTKENNLKKYGVENPSSLNEVRIKVKQTCLERYGVENPSSLNEVRIKVKQTCLEKYGDPHYHNKEKNKQTCLERYGVEHPSQLDSIKEKKIKTSLKRWGVEHPSQSSIIKEKTLRTFNENYIKNNDNILEIICEDGERLYKCKCEDKDCKLCDKNYYLIHKSLYHSRCYQNIEKCPIKNPIDQKTKDTSIERFIRSILDHHNINYETNIRLHSNLELDIYIPSKKIGIECNGIYWHSDRIKQPNYHFNKYKEYDNNGVQVIFIWEDWIKTKPNIVESIILSKLGICENKIYARKCEVKLVPHEDSKLFLERNHIQGNSNSSIRLGLYYNGDLVSLMCFAKKRRNMMGRSSNEGEWELTRFCSLLNTQVIGGASKLLKYFLSKYDYSSIISFASHDISNGQLYDKLGFIKTNSNFGSYWYIDNKTLLRYHRYNFRKSELVKKGFDKDKSEFEIMNELNYIRIYDAGQSKYILTKKELN